MKLDIDYIVTILKTVEDHSEARMLQNLLLSAINVDISNKDEKDKFYYHMKRIEEAGYLDCPPHGNNGLDGFGFWYSSNSSGISSISFLDMEYELTWAGHNFLEAMQSDTFIEKATSFFKDMTFDQIKKQSPVILMELIGKGIWA